MDEKTGIVYPTKSVTVGGQQVTLYRVSLFAKEIWVSDPAVLGPMRAHYAERLRREERFNQLQSYSAKHLRVAEIDPDTIKTDPRTRRE